MAETASFHAAAAATERIVSLSQEHALISEKHVYLPRSCYDALCSGMRDAAAMFEAVAESIERKQAG